MNDLRFKLARVIVVALAAVATVYIIATNNPSGISTTLDFGSRVLRFPVLSQIEGIFTLEP